MALKIKIKRTYENFMLDIDYESNSKRIGILGASGCGKSQTLKSIAGIVKPDKGIIEIDGKIVYDSSAKVNKKPQERNIGYLFQNYALFPTMTVAQNIGTGLKGSKKDNQKRIEEMIDRFHIRGLENRLPGELSGGQQQRVALARIMAYEPDVIMLDEPFSALDIFLKDRLIQELIDMLKDYKGTVIMVSHSRDEIYRFSDDLLIMDKGHVVSCGKMKDIFADPKKKEAARLTGVHNFSKIERIDENTVKAIDWGITLKVQETIPESAVYVGIRAYEFLPVWGEREQNCIKLNIISSAELTSERQYCISPEGAKDGDLETLCWYLLKGKWEELEEKGLPDYLKLPEEHILFLEN